MRKVLPLPFSPAPTVSITTQVSGHWPVLWKHQVPKQPLARQSHPLKVREAWDTLGRLPGGGSTFAFLKEKWDSVKKIKQNI
jgi:hypothetical protein